jgi:uncharacterized protein YkwD
MINLDRLISLHNEYRKSLGIKDILYKDNYLVKYAHAHGEWMSQNNKFIHSSIKNLLKFGYKQVGENIAIGQPSEEQVFNKWIKSYRHRQNIINKIYTNIGCSCVIHDDKTYWVAVFASSYGRL